MHKVEKVDDVETKCTEIFARDLRKNNVKQEKQEPVKGKKGDK
jgi:hypothetical protein